MQARTICAQILSWKIIFISFNSGETQKIIFRIVFTHFLKNDKVDEVEDDTGVDEMGCRRSGNKPFS